VGDNGIIIRRRASGWGVELDQLPTVNLHAVYGDANAIYAVGGAGTVLRDDGGAWNALTPPAYPIWRGVYVADTLNVFVVSDFGAIARFRGSTGELMESNSSEDFMAVWGRDAGEVYAVGSNGVIVHWDGAEWSRMYSPVTRRLWGVFGTTRVFAVGNGGNILWNVYQGFAPQVSGTIYPLLCGWDDPLTGFAFAGGDGGVILRYVPRPVPLQPR
jgi:hypothetical protein